MEADTKSCTRSLTCIGFSAICFLITYFTFLKLFDMINNIQTKNDPKLEVIIFVVFGMVLGWVLYIVYVCFKWSREKNPHSEQIEDGGGFENEGLCNRATAFNEDDVERQIGSEKVAATTKLC